jgi:hypothetical protein
MSESSTRTLKPKKLQTATMKRRALKLKSTKFCQRRRGAHRSAPLSFQRCSRLACEPIRCRLRFRIDRRPMAPPRL